MIIEFVTEQFRKQTMLFSSYGSLDNFFKAQNGFPVLSERYIVSFDRYHEKWNTNKNSSGKQTGEGGISSYRILVNRTALFALSGLTITLWEI